MTGNRSVFRSVVTMLPMLILAACGGAREPRQAATPEPRAVQLAEPAYEVSFREVWSLGGSEAAGDVAFDLALFGTAAIGPGGARCAGRTSPGTSRMGAR